MLKAPLSLPQWQKISTMFRIWCFNSLPSVSVIAAAHKTSLQVSKLNNLSNFKSFHPWKTTIAVEGAGHCTHHATGTSHGKKPCDIGLHSRFRGLNAASGSAPSGDLIEEVGQLLLLTMGWPVTRWQWQLVKHGFAWFQNVSAFSTSFHSGCCNDHLAENIQVWSPSLGQASQLQAPSI